MTPNGFLQIGIFLLVLLAVTKPLGVYMARILEGNPTLIRKLLGPLERLIYRLGRIDEHAEQHWTDYAVQSFLSAATGIALATALIRGVARRETNRIGNFWVDLTRSTLYILLPICLVGALLLVSQGVIQNFGPYQKADLVEPQTMTKIGADEIKTTGTMREQTLPQGPVASQEIIKQLGSIGGGFFNANSAHPYENPTPFSNLISMLAILAIPAGLTYTLGRMAGNQKHGWAIFAAMAFLFCAGIVPVYYFESQGNPLFHRYGVTQAPIESGAAAQAGGNMEGKEVRFGIAQSALHATATTTGSCGSVNSMHDSYGPLSGMIPLANMMLGEIVFGGVGAGLYGMLIMVILTIFVAGQLVGRTPEYLGKKIEAKEVKMAMLATLVFPLTIQIFSAWSSLAPYGVSQINNRGPHGLSEIVYAYTSATGNNGSAFAGLNANTLWYNTTLALAMLIGRFLIIVPTMAMAGSLAAKKHVPPSAGTFPVETPLFIILLISVILIVAALTFFPVLSLGPIVEHLLLKAGRVF